jgi:hypothetical protein
MKILITNNIDKNYDKISKLNEGILLRWETIEEKEVAGGYMVEAHFSYESQQFIEKSKDIEVISY